MADERNQEIDQIVLSLASPEWEKVAVLISRVFETSSLKGIEGLGQQIAERIYILVDSGRLDVQGNMRRWRDGEVRLKQ